MEIDKDYFKYDKNRINKKKQSKKLKQNKNKK